MAPFTASSSSSSLPGHSELSLEDYEAQDTIHVAWMVTEEMPILGPLKWEMCPPRPFSVGQQLNTQTVVFLLKTVNTKQKVRAVTAPALVFMST